MREGETLLAAGRTRIRVPQQRDQRFLGGTLIDEHTGKRLAVVRPDCGADFFGGPWLLFECGSPRVTVLALYRPSTRTWRLVNWDGDARGQPEAVGAYWIESRLDPSCPDSRLPRQR